MQPQRPHPPAKHPIRLHALKNVQPASEVVRVLAKVQVQRAEDAPHGDLAGEGRDKEPGAQVVPRDEGRDPVPELGGRAVRGGGVDKGDLGVKEKELSE